MTRKESAVRRTIPVLALVVVAGCGSGGTSTAPSTTAPSTARSGSSDASTSPTKAADQLPTYHEGVARPIPAGTYVTASDGFFPGLTLTVPSGWTMTEADRGEIGLHPPGSDDNALYLWKDMAAVVTHNRTKKVGQVNDDVGRTPKELIDWLTTTPDFAIVSKPAKATVGSAVQGTELTLAVSGTANFAWDDCPDNPHCAAIFTDPLHWSGFYAIGGDEVARIFIATAHYPEGDHTLFITLDSPDRTELAKLAAEAEPVIQSLRLPPQFVSN